MKEEDVFEEVSASKNPFEQFAKWYTELEKKGGENYNAVALSTSTRNGSVSSRMVLLKDFSSDGFLFFTNYNSRKGKQIDANPFGALLFYWPDFRRQVRVEGIISRIDGEESDRYFSSRIAGHKLNAYASPQSQIISGRESLMESLAELSSKYKDTDPPRPDYWGGFRLSPGMFEFWQEGRERFHDRLEYRPSNDGWAITRLAP